MNMPKKLRLLGFMLCMISVGYWLWSVSGRVACPATPELQLQAWDSWGTDSGHGNLVAIQPFMFPKDYALAANFRAKMAGYFAAAKEKGWLTPKTIVVLPEYIGTWLVAVNEKERVYTAATVNDAMTLMAASNFFSFMSHVLSADAKDPGKYALFRMKAQQMANIYQTTFAGLAKQYGVMVAAGSIVLPDPQVENGILQIGDGKLYNISVLYRPDGRADPNIVKKAFPIPDELDFTTPALVTALPIFETPAGRLAVLICADSWYPEVYQQVKANQAELVVTLSYLFPDNAFHKTWSPRHIKLTPQEPVLTEEQAWLKYSLPGRLSSTDARYGLTVFLRGKFWDLGAEGYTMLMEQGNLRQGKLVNGAAIANLWLSVP